MKRHEQAARIWSVLVYAARVQEILSYTTIEKMTGILRYTQGSILKLIQRYCEHHKIPRLNVLAVSQEDGLPGEGYHHADKSKGNDKGEDERKGKDIGAIFQEQSRVFVYDWLKDDPPTPEDLEKFDD